ncbi:MAG: PorT family protein [Bacteroidales bacterium]|nr:PorT family protein [Bacteroidales bacterium]
MKSLKIILLILLTGNFAFGQTKDTTSIKKTHNKEVFGANKAHYVYAYFNFMFATPPDEGTDADIFYGKSHSVSYGVRYRFKIADFFAVGVGLNYTYYAWHFKQNDSKKIPTSNIYDKEKLKINTLGTDVFLRFNFGKRSNTVGNYIDLGGYGDWDFYDSRVFTNFVNNTNPDGFSTSTGINSNLNYLNKINYGAEVRIGYGKIVLFTKYRLSDIFTKRYKEAISSTELPRLSVGIEIGFHK